jgi:hypothetical protein
MPTSHTDTKPAHTPTPWGPHISSRDPNAPGRALRALLAASAEARKGLYCYTAGQSFDAGRPDCDCWACDTARALDAALALAAQPSK